MLGGSCDGLHPPEWFETQVVITGALRFASTIGEDLAVAHADSWANVGGCESTSG
ncbi:MAG: hypothetical protein J07HQX50_01583 [Haloquadratum sp. J07HQX50]|nr:MAG: hypothetical protein J07HQX50_01583 [Haloquadratum sp. J07HQX50]